MKIGVVVPLEATPATGHVVRYADTRAECDAWGLRYLKGKE
jgi:hypothetical protein